MRPIVGLGAFLLFVVCGFALFITFWFLTVFVIAAPAFGVAVFAFSGAMILVALSAVIKQLERINMALAAPENVSTAAPSPPERGGKGWNGTDEPLHDPYARRPKQTAAAR